MYGINAGYDTRQMATGDTTNGLTVFDPETVFFQQVAINAEAKSNRWGVSAYGLIPIGEYGYSSDNVATINSFYGASPLTTIGADISYNILPDLSISGGYYYQYSEKELDEFESYPDGSGFKGRLAYDLTDQLQAGVIYSYDENFESRISADLKMRFGSGTKSQSGQTPIVINALTATPSHRNVRTANSRMGEFLDRCNSQGGEVRRARFGTFSGGFICYVANDPCERQNAWKNFDCFMDRDRDPFDALGHAVFRPSDVDRDPRDSITPLM